MAKKIWHILYKSSKDDFEQYLGSYETVCQENLQQKHLRVKLKTDIENMNTIAKKSEIKI